MEFKKQQLVGQHNDFIQKTVYKDMTINDAKLFKSIVSKINYKNSLFEDFYIIDYEDLDLAGVPNLHRFREVKKSLKKLSNCFVMIKNEEGDEVELGLISNKFTYKKNTSKIVVEVHDDLKPYLLELKNKYTRYQLENIKEFDSLYTLQIYELCRSWLAKGKFIMGVEQLRDYLNIEEGKYKLFGSFKQKIIQKAINIINDTTDILVSVEEIKQGRSVVKLIFNVDEQINPFLENEEADLTKLLDKVFIDNNGIKFLIMSYEQDKEQKDAFRFRVFHIEKQEITYTPFLKKSILFARMAKQIRETEMIKRVGVK